MNQFDQIVKMLMSPVADGGAGMDEKHALAEAERVMKRLLK